MGRFTQEDTHWNPANRLYGDEPQKINERTDKLGLKTYAYAPDITAVMQSGNLYAYCAGNPVMYGDRTGAFIFTIIGAVAGGISSLFAESFSATEETTWRDYLGAFVGGAVSGAITGAAADFSLATGGVGSVIAFTVVGAVAGGAGAVVDGAISGDLNVSDVLFSAMWGGIFSGLGGLTSGAALKEIERLSAMSVNELVDIFQIALQTELKKGGMEITAELMAEFLWNFAAWFVEGGVEYAASLISD